MIEFSLSDTVYVIQRNPSNTEGQCLLEDGSVVLFSCEDWTDARIASVGIEGIEIVRREDLSPEDRRRVNEAFD